MIEPLFGTAGAAATRTTCYAACELLAVRHGQPIVSERVHLPISHLEVVPWSARRVSCCMLPFEHNYMCALPVPCCPLRVAGHNYICALPVPCCPLRVAGHNRVLSAIVEASRRSFGECLSLTATSATIRMVEPLQVWLQFRRAARELVCCAGLPHARAYICGRVQQWGGIERGA